MISLLFFSVTLSSTLQKLGPQHPTQDEDFIRSIGSLFIDYDYNSTSIQTQNEYFDSPDISVEACKKQLRLAAIAYCIQSQILDKSCENFDETTNDIEVVGLMSNTQYQTSGFVTLNHVEENIVVSYRGSKNIANWILNFNIGKIKYYKDTKIHKGFKTLADSLIQQTIKYIRLLLDENPGYNVIFVGHSMGGAVAIINAVETMTKLKLPESQISIYTYGQPRIGDKKFVNYINSLNWNINRVFNSEDIVPTMPPNWTGYYHTNVGIAIGPNEETNICNPNSKVEDLGCLESVEPKNTDAHFVYWDYTIQSMP